VAGGPAAHVLFRPLTLHLALRHLGPRVDDDVVIETLLHVAEDSLAVAHAVPSQITPAHVELTRLLVLVVRDEPVTGAEDALVCEDAAHGGRVVSSYLV
jgi:hypothetical protein